MLMPQQNESVENAPTANAVRELSIAHDDLTRLSALLKHAFDELLTSFSALHAATASGGSEEDIEHFTARAITALQCDDLANQLIGFTQQRLAFISESLKINSQMPQIVVTNAASDAGNAASITQTMAAPVQQDAMHAGTIDLF
jgi:hypothetical protein